MKTIKIITAAAAIVIANTFMSCDSGSELGPGASPVDADTEGYTIVVPQGYGGYLDPSVASRHLPTPSPASGYSPFAGGELPGYGNQTVVVYSDNPTTPDSSPAKGRCPNGAEGYETTRTASYTPSPASGYSPFAGGEMTGYGNQTTARHCEGLPEANQSHPQEETLDCFVPRNDGTLTTPDSPPAKGEYPVGGRGSGEVPASRAEGSKTRLSTHPTTGLSTWQDGDLLYLGISYTGATRTDKIIGRYTTPGGWQFSHPLTPPQGATAVHIRATYTGGEHPGERAYKNDFVWSLTDYTIDGNDTEIALADFKRSYSRFTFTGLDVGDEVRITGENTYLTVLSLSADYLNNTSTNTGGGDFDHTNALTLSVPTGQTEVSCYAAISNPTPHAIKFRVTRPGGLTSPVCRFTPNDNGQDNSRQFQIDCAGIFPGTEDPASLEAREKARLIKWIQDYNMGRTTDGFTLQCSIDVSDIGNFPQIVGPGNRFTATFDGGGFTITGLKMNTTADGAGLFYWIGSGGTVTRLTLQGADIASSGTYYAGGLAIVNEGTISHCTLAGTAVSGSAAGGVVGNNYSEVTACTFAGTVKATDRAGGITANNNTSARITACVSRASTISGNTAGGIAGQNDSGTLIACISGETTITGTIGRNTPRTGGIVGYNNGTSALTACYSLATSITVETGNNKGGIAGYNTSNATLTACHWLTGGNVPTEAQSSGSPGTATNCHPFAGATNFYAAGTGNNINLMQVMNDALPAAGINAWEWTDASNKTQYPTLKKKP